LTANDLPKSPALTHANHQPLRRTLRRHIKHPRGLLLVFALREHVSHAGQGHHGELKAFADLHGHHFDGVAGGVKVAGAAVHFYRHLALMQHLSPQVARAVVRAQNGHVAPGEAFFVGLGEVVCNRKGFFAQAGEIDDEGDAVVVFVPVTREAQAPSAGMRVAMLLVSQYLVVPYYEAYNEVFKEIFIIHMNISQISSDEFQVEIIYIRENEHGLILTFC
jgi:hypothetical protein